MCVCEGKSRESSFSGSKGEERVKIAVCVLCVSGSEKSELAEASNENQLAL
ncbi:hypothetical protein COLO4_38412 [Corchorus olitorius]|uniref:Uncharacterized protein n=1 Tax=Corchorus olitorius TaxID=93759 RepID=A0A1R3FVD1_9ROSI|nr:hypothetical protein COLO4_38412 [Corchorus olitorius]